METLTFVFHPIKMPDYCSVFRYPRKKKINPTLFIGKYYFCTLNTWNAWSEAIVSNQDSSFKHDFHIKKYSNEKDFTYYRCGCSITLC